MAFIPPWGEPVTDSLTGYSKFFKVFLEWADASYEPRFYKVELFRSLTNNRATAISLGFPENNRYEDADVSAGLSYYYWVRDYNFDDTPQGYYPVSATAGVQVDVPYVVTSDIANGSVSEVTVVESPSSIVGIVSTSGVEAFSILGSGATAIFSSSLGNPILEQDLDVYSKAAIHVDRQLVNLSSGGILEVQSINSNYGSYAFFNKGNAVPFVNPQNVKVQDGNLSTGIVSSAVGTNFKLGDMQYYYGYDFSSIPSTAHILGIQVTVRAYHNFASGGSPSLAVWLCWDGTNFPSDGGVDISGNELTQIFTSTSLTTYVVGASSMVTAPWRGRRNLNFHTNTGYIKTADVKDPKFGVIVAPVASDFMGNYNGVQYNIDLVQLKIIYTTYDIVKRSIHIPIEIVGGVVTKEFSLVDTFVQYMADFANYHMRTNVRILAEDTNPGAGLLGNVRWYANTTKTIITELKR